MADKAIRNNSPDETKYHEGVEGMPGIMIPRAGHEGSSRGISHDTASQVVVDPGEPGGGFTLDMGALSGTKEKFNSAAVRNDVLEDPQAFYRGLANAQKEPKPPIKKEPKMEKEATTTSTPQPLQPLQPLPPISSVEGMAGRTSALEKLLQEEKAKAEARALADQGNFDGKMAAAESARVAPLYYDGHSSPPPGVFRDTSPSDSYMLQQLMAGMAQQRETINGLIALQTEKAAVVEDVVDEEWKQMEKEPEYAVPGIPFLEGGLKAQRPNYEIYFEMPKMGTMAARYHAVVEGNDCLALIYDTRFEDGFQYLPPSLGEEQISVSVPKLSKTPYTCSSLGLHWTLGCMDVVILIKHSDGE